jgi:hypothetical protein
MVSEHVPDAEEEAAVGGNAEPELLVSGDHALVQLSWNMALSEVVE